MIAKLFPHWSLTTAVAIVVCILRSWYAPGEDIFWSNVGIIMIPSVAFAAVLVTARVMR